MPQQLKEIANPVWGSFETHENFSTYMSKSTRPILVSKKSVGWGLCYCTLPTIYIYIAAISMPLLMALRLIYFLGHDTSDDVPF